MKTYNMESFTMGCVRFEYFYKREKNDVNGNSRFRVYIIDPENNAVYEKLFQCYDFQVKNCVMVFIENMINKAMEG